MYRYSVDNAITYTSEDFVLFREAPFACWMERLTLENPDHGIPPDLGSSAPRDSMERQDELADTLRAEGKNVSHISWDDDEPGRRAATLQAMRSGVDFIVDGHLALGPLAGPANLLVRTSGYSEFGDFLYLPCDTQARSIPGAAFRLAFLADLLHSLQGQLPPQMLLIRGGDDLVSLQTDDYIYHYRAVKQRFMAAMRAFRKHRMPDPAESSHFGRWSDCAHEVLKQRLLRGDSREGELDSDYVDAATGAEAQPLRHAVGSALGRYDLDSEQQTAAPTQQTLATEAAAIAGPAPAAASTLVEQARQLAPGTYKPGPGYFRLRKLAPATRSKSPQAAEEAVPCAEEAEPQHNRRASDPALQNLEFIGSSKLSPTIGQVRPPEPALPSGASTAPSPSLRDPRLRMPPVTPGQPLDTAGGMTTIMRASFEEMTWETPRAGPVPAAVKLPPDAEQESSVEDTEAFSNGAQHSAAKAEPAPAAGSRSVIDMDDTHTTSPAPTLATATAHYFEDEETGQSDAPKIAARPFSDSIFNDPLFTDPLFDEPRREPAGQAKNRRFSDRLTTSEDQEG